MKKKNINVIALILFVIAILATIIIVKSAGNKDSEGTELQSIKSGIEESEMADTGVEIESIKTDEIISEEQNDYEISLKQLVIHSSDVTYEILGDEVILGGLTLKFPSDYEYSECQTNYGEKKIVVSHPHEDSDFLLHDIEILVYEVDEFPDTVDQFIYDLLHSLHLEEEEFYCFRNNDNMKEPGIFLRGYLDEYYIFLLEKEDNTFEIVSMRPPAYYFHDGKNFSDLLKDGDIVQTYQKKNLNRDLDTHETYRLSSTDYENGILLSSKHDSFLLISSIAAEKGFLTYKNDIEVSAVYYDLFTDVNGDGIKDIIFDVYDYYTKSLLKEKIPDRFFAYVWNLNEKKYEKIEGMELDQRYGDYIVKYYSCRVEKVSNPIPKDLKEFVSQLAL